MYKKKDLISTFDLSKEQILYFLQTAKKFKELNKQNIKKSDILRGKTIINAFFENSTRTRVSFESAAKRLGADAINFSSSQSSTKKGETLVDTIKNMEAMKTDIFVVRHAHSGAAKFIADNSNASIINAGDGANEHPTQALLDLMSIQEKTDFKDLNIAIIGDIANSRVARSNIWAMKTLGFNVTLFGPPFMMPLRSEIFGCKIAENIQDALIGADVIMMLRIQLERQNGDVSFPSSREYSKFFGLTKDRVKLANKDVIILHPGPINRGVEINSDVADSNASIILNQVENGVAIRMAVLEILSKNRENL